MFKDGEDSSLQNNEISEKFRSVDEIWLPETRLKFNVFEPFHWRAIENKLRIIHLFKSRFAFENPSFISVIKIRKNLYIIVDGLYLLSHPLES